MGVFTLYSMRCVGEIVFSVLSQHSSYTVGTSDRRQLTSKQELGQPQEDSL